MADARYGYAHRKLRAEWAKVVERGEAFCARCGEWIDPAEPFDLGHTDDGTAYVGPEHAYRCNRAEGGRKRHRVIERRRWAL